MTDSFLACNRMEELNEILDTAKDQSSQKEQDEILLQPFAYIQQIPGKQFRAKLALALNHWLQIPDEKFALIGEIVQMLHNSSLLLHSVLMLPRCNEDAPEDSILSSCYWRGIPVAHSIYGVASTINAANYVLFLALEKVQLLNHPEATKVYTEQLLELHRGQGMEIYWRDNFTCPTESGYKLMTIRKTGGLFMLAIRLMQLFSSNKKDFSKLTAILGLYFQIRDDYCNLRSKEYSENKSYCEDLTEGKFSFPIIHALQNKQNRQVLHILRQRTRDVEVKKYCVNLLENLGSFKYTRDILESLDRQAREEVARLGPNPIMEKLLDDLLSWKTA
ncbi:geranylgeranyl pyrophosphate synthase isoform X2 [Hermetia illucens]|uniref:geranylgeranyl pyrophosphate synthase isoform X2 n=1 Tax=Hermetia illucens TaxID=343691 RepID=UPI0018CC5F06|nr:geranylgeranyl pyrophosphate synthase isoform X2 [Hermetia illucens]